MKNFALVLLSLLFFSTLSAQEKFNQKDAQGRKHGTWKKYHDNGELRYVGSFDHGTAVDTFFFYFENGGLMAMNVFRGKSGVAYSKQYGDEEKLAAEGKYVNQKKDSVWTFYDMDGNLLSREPYEDNKRHGKSVTYFENGKVAEETTYKEGVKHGPWRQFFESGKPKSKGEYVKGSLQGEVFYYSLQGKIRMKGNYQKGKMHGNWYYFDDYGEVEKKEVWRYGQLMETEPEQEKEERDFNGEEGAEKEGWQE